MDRAGTACYGTYRLLPTKVSFPIVLVPGDLVVIVGGREHVQVPVIIQIGGMYRSGAICLGRDKMVLESPLAQVLVPGNLIVRGRGREHVHVPIAVQVGRIHRLGCLCICIDQLLVGLSITKIAPAKVLVPGDLVVIGRGREHVQVPVIIQIGRIYRLCASCLGRDKMITEFSPAQVLRPGDLVVTFRGREDVHIPVPVQICCMDRSGPRSMVIYHDRSRIFDLVLLPGKNSIYRVGIGFGLGMAVPARIFVEPIKAPAEPTIAVVLPNGHFGLYFSWICPWNFRFGIRKAGVHRDSKIPFGVTGIVYRSSVIALQVVPIYIARIN